MRPLIEEQRRLRVLGVLRLGHTEVRNGKRVPVKETEGLRVTSDDRQVIESFAAQYGGQVEPWDNDGRPQWEVRSPCRELAVLLPSHMSLRQEYEAYAKGFKTKGCDGRWDVVRDCACDCDPETMGPAELCAMTTRLFVILPDLPGLGVWMLVSHGWYAATGLGASVDLLRAATAAGVQVPARLRLVDQERRRLVGGKAKVFKFLEPVLDIDTSIDALGAALAPGASPVVGAPQQALPQAPGVQPPAAGQPAEGSAHHPSRWRPLKDAALPAAPVLTVREQVADVDRPAPRRKNSRPLVASTGIEPRTANEAEPAPCSLCGEPLGTAEVRRNPASGGSRFVHRACLEADSQEPGAGTPGGTDGGPDARAAEPAEGAGPAVVGKGPTQWQFRKMMALVAEVHPAPPGADADAHYRAVLLGLAAALGQPGLTSRRDMSWSTAQAVVDTLVAIAGGDVDYDPSTGTLTDLASGAEP